MKWELLREAFRREAFTISFDELAAFTEVYGFVGRSGRVFLEGHLLTPRGAGEEERDTLILFMHPASSLGLLPLPTAMAAAGFHVMCGGSRYLRNDTALIMEKVALDMGAYVRHARTISVIARWCWPGGAGAARSRSSIRRRRNGRPSP